MITLHTVVQSHHVETEDLIRESIMGNEIMYNELIRIGPVTIYGYGLMIAIGILIAYKVVVYRAASRQVELSHVSSLTFWSLLGGLAGAKLLFWITQMNNIIHDPSMVLNFSEGFVVYGGIIGGLGLVMSIVRRKAQLSKIP